jgi:hypothetical protein
MFGHVEGPRRAFISSVCLKQMGADFARGCLAWFTG